MVWGDGGGLVRLPASGVRGLYVLGISGASGTHVDRPGLSTMTSTGGDAAAGEVGAPEAEHLSSAVTTTSMRRVSGALRVCSLIPSA